MLDERLGDSVGDSVYDQGCVNIAYWNMGVNRILVPSVKCSDKQRRESEKKFEKKSEGSLTSRSHCGILGYQITC
jgi:hypothetical protein